jgi:hypothetical protein
MVTLGDKIMPKLCSNFSCKICDYNTNKKSSFENHLMSCKHKKQSKGLQMGQNYAQIMPTSFTSSNICICGKQYQHRLPQMFLYINRRSKVSLSSFDIFFFSNNS